MKLKYITGGENIRESVEFPIMKRGQYITTCVIDAYMLSIGLAAAPCGNGDDYKLTPEEQLEVLEYIERQREAIRSRDAIKNKRGWGELGSLELYVKPGDKVEEAIVDDMINAVPSITFNYGFAQAGEPYSCASDSEGKWGDTYYTFTRTEKDDGNGGKVWIFNGCCHKGKWENLVEFKTNVQKRIEDLKSKIERRRKDGDKRL